MEDRYATERDRIFRKSRNLRDNFVQPGELPVQAPDPAQMSSYDLCAPE
jgi:hypothetical protein